MELSWTNSTNMGTARGAQLGGAGTQTAGLAFGGTGCNNGFCINRRIHRSLTFATQTITTS
jgi:hypothetical protein